MPNGELFRPSTTFGPIKDLDFFVSFSSAASMFGNAGQSNYAAANSVVDGFLRGQPNAFSVVLPGISDLGCFARIRENSPVHATFLSWSMTSHRKHPFVPQVPFTAYGMDSLCKHELTRRRVSQRQLLHCHGMFRLEILTFYTFLTTYALPCFPI